MQISRTRAGRWQANQDRAPIQPFRIEIPAEDRFRAAFQEPMSIVSRQLVRLAIARAMLTAAKPTQDEAIQIVADQLCLPVEAISQAVEHIEEPATWPA